MKGKMRSVNKNAVSKAAVFVLSFILTAFALSAGTRAAGTLTVEDGAGLLTDEEEAQLIADYSEITDYMPAAFVSTDSVSGTTNSFAEAYAIRHYGNDPAVIFVIDMDNRNIYIYANGSALKTISKADSRAITDNIYKEASRGNYYGCADAAFGQILAKCRGERLARPVKHITNALIAALAGILINYGIVIWSRTPKKQRRTKGEVTVSVSRQMAAMPGIALGLPVIISTVKHYKSDSSGSGGGGGGGGGHSGGGGGHSF